VKSSVNRVLPLSPICSISISSRARILRSLLASWWSIACTASPSRERVRPFYPQAYYRGSIRPDWNQAIGERLSILSLFRYSFVVADKSGNGTGFTATWTEVLDNADPCSGFQCENSTYCISSQLRCNSVLNCGSNDVSDEINCEYDIISSLYWLVATLAGWYWQHKRVFLARRP